MHPALGGFRGSGLVREQGPVLQSVVKVTAFWEHAGSEKHGRRTRRRKGERGSKRMREKKRENSCV